MDKFDPMNITQQLALLPKHPLVTNDYKVLTPSMPIVLEATMDAVMLHKRSLFFKAMPQMGKTQTCLFAAKAIEEFHDFQDRLVIVVTADPRGEESILKNIARTSMLKLPSRPNLSCVRSSVLAYIESRLRSLNGRHIVLFIDEMQALTLADFENLQFLQNELGLRNIGVTTIGFGQTQIEATISLLREQGRPELIARFLNEECDLPRCMDHFWMAAALSMFDEHLTYPVGSDCSFTRFFLPQAYESGFRLTGSANEIHQIMKEAAKKATLAVLPTVYVLEVFRLILIRLRTKDSSEFELKDDAIWDAVKESQLHTYSTYLKSGE
jgi:hypothetical protein